MGTWGPDVLLIVQPDQNILIWIILEGNDIQLLLSFEHYNARGCETKHLSPDRIAEVPQMMAELNLECNIVII